MDWATTTARGDEKYSSLGFGVAYIKGLTVGPNIPCGSIWTLLRFTVEEWYKMWCIFMVPKNLACKILIYGRNQLQHPGTNELMIKYCHVQYIPLKIHIALIVLCSLFYWHINTLRTRQNGRHFADGIVKCIFLIENLRILIKISLKFAPKDPINNIPALAQKMAWCRPGDKPLSEPTVVRLPTHICITRPQWVKACANGCHFTNSIFMILCIFLNERSCTLIHVSLWFVAGGPSLQWCR